MSAAARLPLEALAYQSVGLDQLVREAALLSRVDRKYLLPLEIAAEAMAGLDPRTRVLEIDGRRDFAYDSVYFDTEDHLAYRLTAQRRRRRFKLRTRSYLDTGGCFLEVKTKNGRGATVKQRVPYEPAHRDRLTGPGRDYAGEVLRGSGLGGVRLERLRPVLRSGYHRITMLLPEGSRATFDTRLRWESGSSGDVLDGVLGTARDRVRGNAPDRVRRLELSGHAIVETKSAGGASALDRALWRLGHRPLGISKFGTGLAALHPELPRNKWARVLRTFEAAAPTSGTTITIPSEFCIRSEEYPDSLRPNAELRPGAAAS